MEYFYIGLGIVGFTLAISAYARLNKLEKYLTENEIIPKDWEK